MTSNVSQIRAQCTILSEGCGHVMKILRFKMKLAFLATIALSGCVTQSVVVEPRSEPDIVKNEQVPSPNYEAVTSRSPEMIASLRAAPPPAQPELVEGRSIIGDQRTLSARGFVHIGTSRHRTDANAAQDKALAVGKEVGADQVLVYRNEPLQNGAGNEFVAMYYVRFKLLFGATFRNLTARERESLDGSSGVEIGSVIGGTPASQANLMAGDFVLAFNGRSFKDRTEFQQLLSNHAGKAVTLLIRRGDVTMDRVVRLGAMPADAASGHR
jgi:hypothetical protein